MFAESNAVDIFDSKRILFIALSFLDIIFYIFKDKVRWESKIEKDIIL